MMGAGTLEIMDTHDWFVHRLAQHLQMTIFAVAYRLAPEHRYPAANVMCVWYGMPCGRVYWGVISARIDLPLLVTARVETWRQRYAWLCVGMASNNRWHKP